MSEETFAERPESGMDTGSDAGSPGERNDPDFPADEVSEAVADDGPLTSGPPGAGDGGDQGDGLAPEFLEPDTD